MRPAFLHVANEPYNTPMEGVAEILLHENELPTRVAALAGEIADAHPDRDRGITIVTVLSGSIVFLADLLRQLPLKTRLGLIHVSSYAGRNRVARGPTLIGTSLPDLHDQDVLIVDDILETGGTLRLVQSAVADAGPRAVRTAVLLRKPCRRDPEPTVDFVGFEIEDVFVVGYGLDYNGWYRNLPYVAALRAGPLGHGMCG